MKLNIDPEWCRRAAEREGDCEIGAGALARDPMPESPFAGHCIDGPKQGEFYRVASCSFAIDGGEYYWHMGGWKWQP